MANTDFSVLLKAVLDKSGINTELKQVQEIVKKYHMEVTPDLKTKSLRNQFRSVCQEMANDFNKAFGTNITGNDMFKVYENKAKQLEQTLQRVNKIQQLSSTGHFAKQISDTSVEYNKLSSVTDELKADFTELKRLEKELSKPQVDDSNYEAFNTTLEKVKNSMHILANEQEQAGTYNLNALADKKKIDTLAESVLKFRDNNTKMSKGLRSQFTGIYDSLINGTNLTEKEVKELAQEFANLKLKVRDAGQLGQSFGDKMKNAFKKFSEWGFATGLVTNFTSKVKNAITELKELDDILTEITKTSDLTERQLEKLGNISFDTASKYGKKASGYLTGVQEMYRAGFDNAEEMAELSVLAQSAGDMETDSANDYLMATNAAYKYKGSVEELNKVLDSQNYITNNAAISMQDIADATTETASVASQYGVQISELSALIATATANTRESGSEVGTALKAILINLQDVTSKPVTDTMNKLGISMFKVVDGAERLKTPIELIYELADAYNSLPEGDVMRATILNEIGQKRHANTLSSILSDMESFESMLALYNSTEADGSAFREAEKSANNLSGTLNKLSNSWVKLINTFVNAKGLTKGVNIINDLVGNTQNLIENFGVLPSLIVAIGTAFGTIKQAQSKSGGLMSC